MPRKKITPEDKKTKVGAILIFGASAITKVVISIGAGIK